MTLKNNLEHIALHKKQVSLFGLLVFLLVSCGSSEKTEYTEIKDGKIVEASFVGSETCKSCHQETFNKWQGSHHDLAMDVANDSTVLGNFDNSRITHQDITSTFFKKDDGYYVNTQGLDGSFSDYKIEYVFGVTPLQQYLIKFENGEYQCLSTAWDSVKNEWFTLNDQVDINHGDRLHWTGSAMSWNTMCADCHSTNLQKNYSSKTDSYKTTFSEIDVSCEACHGPSSSHVSFYENPTDEYHPPSIYMNSEMTSTELVDKCARCHSRRSQLTKYFDYKGKFEDHYAQSMLIDPIYELDGQIRDEDYVYGSFIQSKMYHNGVSCKDCHDVHTLKLKKEGNDLCMQCHTPNYNEPSHHFHGVGSNGAQCINCHMPGKTYMGNDFRRDHSFRVPRPDQTVAYGVPNSCTGCHDDKTAQWAADVVIEKFGTERADHFSDYLLKGAHGDLSAYEYLMANDNYPDIARATAVNRYASYPLNTQQIQKLVGYLNDSSSTVRNEVVRGMEVLNNSEMSPNIAAMLQDSVRLVRISTAQYFNMMGIDISANPNFKKANKEFLESMNINADFSTGQHQIGLYYQAKGKEIEAIKSYERAVKIDRFNNRSRMNLALLYYQQDKVKESEALYLKVVEQEPEFGYSYYMLGLLYNETGNIQKSMEYMEQSLGKQPVNPNAFYNYALMLQQENKYNKSLEIVRDGLDLMPNNERLLYVKLIAEMNTNNANAIKTCELLLRIAPNNQNYQQIYNRLRGTN
ncbi:multiheme c-type cytochrome [Urechidicola vernalis]|uniref:Multiheme c-type cytochrome n=1 Tax=Urechidicola vernalis TaxID=3075600 RepID=A0ABU2Y5I3_9FLAO|nr:multiheme c-type cytochrome [Urechidicola sp. P050]MDT0553441.1 multiheme c-type cytochrome [Urechidicola sp. P050]